MKKMKMRKLLSFAMPAVLIMAGGILADSSSASAKKILVVYFSKSGNTAVVAKEIQSMTGGDIFEIETTKPYPADYKATTEQAKKELNDGFRPALKNKVSNMAQYDTIIIGSPCWWGTVATPVMTFLESYDFSGKTIAPFITHGGSRLGRSVDDIVKLCPKAKVTSGLAVRGSSAGKSKNDVKKWLNGIGIAVSE